MDGPSGQGENSFFLFFFTETIRSSSRLRASSEAPSGRGIGSRYYGTSSRSDVVRASLEWDLALFGVLLTRFFFYKRDRYRIVLWREVNLRGCTMEFTITRDISFLAAHELRSSSGNIEEPISLVEEIPGEMYYNTSS